jgi:threonine dehydrogenase-like Zn-dependent dehydrogenase
MKALTWHGTGDVRIDTHPDPRIQEPEDIVIRTTATAICGSDLHIYDGFVLQMESGDILGHEFMGEVVEVGSAVTKFKKGDRVVVPFVIACGHCWFCRHDLWSACDTTNPDHEKLEKMHGHAGAGLFGYSHPYLAHIAVQERGIQTEQGWRPLEPGMAVTAEIKTGRRRVIEYLLPPLARYKHESLRER